MVHRENATKKDKRFVKTDGSYAEKASAFGDPLIAKVLIFSCNQCIPVYF